MSQLVKEVKEEAREQYANGNVRWDQYDAYHGLSKPVVEDTDFIEEIMKRNGIEVNEETNELFFDLCDEACRVYREIFEKEMNKEEQA